MNEIKQSQSRERISGIVLVELHHDQLWPDTYWIALLKNAQISLLLGEMSVRIFDLHFDRFVEFKAAAAMIDFFDHVMEMLMGSLKIQN